MRTEGVYFLIQGIKLIKQLFFKDNIKYVFRLYKILRFVFFPKKTELFS